jgi:alkylhydroperoxidase family enzyme
MLGRSVGLSTEQINHLGDDPLPEGVYDEAEATIVRYAQVSTRSIKIDQNLYDELTKYFDVQQIIEICLMIGASNFVNRFHATFLTDVDESTLDAVEACDRESGTCTLPRLQVLAE